MHNPSVLLRDIRNIKKNSTLALSMTSKDLGSVKDLKKARSSEQIINLKGFLDNKNDKIKTIDQKLDFHQNQIEKNGAIIEQLTTNLFGLKTQFTIQKEKLDIEQKKNKQMRQQIQRTNKLLKTKNFKIQELTKKSQSIQKQLEMLRTCQAKVEELTKVNNQIRKQMNKLQQALQEKKTIISDQTKQVERLKDKINEIGSLKTEIQKHRASTKQKDQQIGQLSMRIRQYERQNLNYKQKNQQISSSLSNQLKEVAEKLKSKQNMLLQARINQKKTLQKVEKLQKQVQKYKSDLQGKQSFSQTLRKQLKQLKQKFQNVNSAINKRQQQQKYQAQKNQTMKAKIEELQKKLQGEQQSVSKLLPFASRIQNLQKKTKRLEELYNLMLPQIQCPFGHELKNPITVIPCGHNYCLGCKKGYTKECMLCNGKLKIEAVYRNQLMDDIINIVTAIKQILEMIK